MVIKGLNHQVNPLDLVQIKAKHEIWQVQNIRQRSQVTSAGHCSVDKYYRIFIPHGGSLLRCRPLQQLWNYKMCMERITRQKHESALEGSCSALRFPSNITSTGCNERLICLLPQ